jgi:hypothetical protein
MLTASEQENTGNTNEVTSSGDASENEPQTQEEVMPQKSARDQMLDEIARKQYATSEGQETAEQGQQPEGLGGQENVHSPREGEETQATGGDTGTKAEEQKRIRVKVDQRDEEVTVDDLVTSYQKNRAADVRLEEAAKAKQQAEMLRKQAEEYLQTLQATTPTQREADEGDTPASPPPTVSPPDFSKIAHSAHYEDVEDLEARLQEAFGPMYDRLQHLEGRVQTGPVTDNLTAAVDQRLDERDKKTRHEMIRNNMKESFPEILEHPGLQAQAHQLVLSYLEAGDPDDWPTYKKAAEETRRWVADVHKQYAGEQGTQNQGPTLRDKTMQKKASEGRIVTGVKPTSKPTYKPPTQHDRIMDMKRIRGQLVP